MQQQTQEPQLAVVLAQLQEMTTRIGQLTETVARLEKSLQEERGRREEAERRREEAERKLADMKRKREGEGSEELAKKGKLDDVGAQAAGSPPSATSEGPLKS